MAAIIDSGPGIAGTFYTVLALWWFVQVTKRYTLASHRRLEFHSSVIYPCCKSCRKWPVEGVIKFIVSLLIVIYFAYKSGSKAAAVVGEHENSGWITVFIAFSFSGVCDIMFYWCQRYTFPSLDYIGLVFAFTIQGIMCSYNTEIGKSWTSLANTCTMFAAVGVAIAIILEFRQPHFIWFSLLRTFCTLVLGTWLIHIAFDMKMLTVISLQVLPSPNMTSVLSHNATADISRLLKANTLNIQHMLLVPMYFTWHCLADLIILSGLWMIAYRLVSINKCCCQPEEDEESQFENRVNFDYRLIDRLESDLD